jgi:hypothetical protein
MRFTIFRDLTTVTPIRTTTCPTVNDAKWIMERMAGKNDIL